MRRLAYRFRTINRLKVAVSSHTIFLATACDSNNAGIDLADGTFADFGARQPYTNPLAVQLIGCALESDHF
jgi:hypothetical protein